jgi:hypothetical protein
MKLIAMIDDATSTLAGRFVAEDSTAEHMRVLRKYLEQNGRPQAYYTDKAGLFRVNQPKKAASEEPSEVGETQIGRALRELGIELIHAHSPQAKGRVERCFGTLQDRLVKGLRKAGAKTREEANRYLERVFLPDWNRRFRQEPASAVDGHRPLGASHDLDSILGHVEKRRVANNYTVSWEGKTYQIAADAVRPGLRSSWVRVEGRLDGGVWARIGERLVQLRRCEPAFPELRLKAEVDPRKDHNRGGRSTWMENFSLKRRAAARAMEGARRVG